MTGKRKNYNPDDIYNYIVEYAKAHGGNSPTLRRITDDCGISSTSVTSYWISKLELDGKIKRVDGNLVITNAKLHVLD